MGARASGLPLSIAVWQTSLQNVKVKVGSSKNLMFAFANIRIASCFINILLKS